MFKSIKQGCATTIAAAIYKLSSPDAHKIEGGLFWDKCEPAQEFMDTTEQMIKKDGLERNMDELFEDMPYTNEASANLYYNTNAYLERLGYNF